jgi:hypothetical protein
MKKAALLFIAMIAAAAATAQEWQLSTQTDPMTDAQVHVILTAEIGGEEQYRPAFLGVRIEGESVQVIFLTNKVSPDTEVMLRFDEEEPFTEDMIDAGGDGMLVHSRSREFLREMIEHQRLVVRFWDWDDEPTTVIYDLAELPGRMREIGW